MHLASSIINVELFTIPNKNLSAISLRHVTTLSVDNPAVAALRNQVTAATLDARESDDEIHYFKGSDCVSEEFYFEVTFKRERHPRSIWLGLASEKWFALNEIDDKFGSGLEAWGYELLTGSLRYRNIPYAHDPIFGNGDITVGFGVTRFKRDEEQYSSVYYVKDGEPGKEIVRQEYLPDSLYPVVRLRQPSSDLNINSTGPFTYQGRERHRHPHQTPIGLFECSPDRRYAASFSAADGILSVWCLRGPDPKFVKSISVPDFKFNANEDSDDPLRQNPYKQLSLAVSNTDGGDFPKLALSRYHATSPTDDCQVRFLNYPNQSRLPNKVAGRIHILDDGDTLLILGATCLFVVSMKSRSLLRTFDTKELNLGTAIPAIGLHIAPSADVERPLKPFGAHHFIWHRDANHLTMWHKRTGRLKQTFRFTFQVDTKYDYDEDHQLVAFYGLEGLRVFTAQTGISISEAERENVNGMKIIAVKFVTVDHDTPRLVTVDGSDEKYMVRVWNPLNGSTVMKDISDTHMFSDRFLYSCVDIGRAGLSSVKVIIPLMATATCLVVEVVKKVFSPPNTTPQIMSLPLQNPPVRLPFEGQYSGQKQPCLEITGSKNRPKPNVQISGFRRRPVTVNPEPWNNRSLTCCWISEDRFVAVGRHSVQILNASLASYERIGIEFAWCLPSKNATMKGVDLVKTHDGKTLQQMVFMYEDDGKPYQEIVNVDVTRLSISPKHASRYLQLSLNYPDSVAACEHKDALNLALQSPKDMFLLNEIDFETKTSTLGHIVRGPPGDVVERMQVLFGANACRPRFYDDKLWNQSVLTDALDAQNFKAVEEIVKYCLKSVSTGNGADITSLEPGYVAIVLAALPAISRAKPLLAIWIAQYISNVQPSRLISSFDEAEFDSRKSRFSVFARVEQLKRLKPLERTSVGKFPTQLWLEKRRELLGAWWSKRRQPRPVRLCLSPLYGINHYPVGGWLFPPFQLSAFAQLAFQQSAVFDEPAFRAVVQYKWNTFAWRYYVVLLFLYISYSVIYLATVTMDSYGLMNPGIKWTLIVLTVLFLLVFHIYPLIIRWNSLTYWSSVYYWIDRTTFVLVLVSTILTSTDYGSSIDLQAWTVLALWLFIILSFRVFEGLGLFFTVLIGIMTRIGWLIIIMTAILFAFAHALWILLHQLNPKISAPDIGNSPNPNTTMPDNPFATFDGSLKLMWDFLSTDFAAIDGWNGGRSLDIMRILFTFVSTIVLLNVLIAILNSVYNDTRSQAQKTWIRNRAEFIATVEVFMMIPSQRQNRNWFPAVVFYEVTPDELCEYETVKSKIPWMNSQSGTNFKT